MAEHQDETRAAYDGVVERYASMFADGLESQPFARNMIGTFADWCAGRVTRVRPTSAAGPDI